MDLSDQIELLQEKVQQLLRQYHAVQKENLRLTKENQQWKEKFEHKHEQTQQLQQKVEALRITSSGLTDDVKKDLEKRINGYLKEIDKCLTLLNA